MQNQTEQTGHLVNVTEAPADERFSDRLIQLLANDATPAAQVEAAVIVYERLRTAAAICRSVLDGQPDTGLVFDVYKELSDEEYSAQQSPA